MLGTCELLHSLHTVAVLQIERTKGIQAPYSWFYTGFPSDAGVVLVTFALRITQEARFTSENYVTIE